MNLLTAPMRGNPRDICLLLYTTFSLNVSLSVSVEKGRHGLAKTKEWNLVVLLSQLKTKLYICTYIFIRAF